MQVICFKYTTEKKVHIGMKNVRAKWLLTAAVVLFLIAYLIYRSFSQTPSVKPIIKPLTLFNISVDRKETKIIYFAANIYLEENNWTFHGCRYDNCKLFNHEEGKFAANADLVLFPFNALNHPELNHRLRERQLWYIVAHESPSYRENLWTNDANNGFNGTVTFRHDSTFYYPNGVVLKRKKLLAEGDYSVGKTKGAFAYVSNCGSLGYDRLRLMHELSKYIDVDVFGKCTTSSPCGRFDWECEKNLHKQYRFYLSFENSLCKEYITEKFWFRINSGANFLPVAIGGLTVEEYTRVAPPDSFLHVYNFSTVEDLGKYLKYLKNNDRAYNQYHRWRKSYMIENDDAKILQCKLCAAANEKHNYNSQEKFADWFNAEGSCRSFSI